MRIPLGHCLAVEFMIEPIHSTLDYKTPLELEI